MVPLLTLATVAGMLSGGVQSMVGDIVLDHVPIAVNDLDSASATYRRLGFTVRPGRIHTNALHNVFLTFGDGTELELITAGEDGDSLAAWYREFARRRERAAFVAFRTPTLDRITATLAAAGVAFIDSGGEAAGFRTVAVAGPEPFRRIFFIQYRDRPPVPDSLTRHANTVTGIRSVWLTVADMRAATEWLEGVGWAGGPPVPFQPFGGLGRAFPSGGGDLILVAPTDLVGYTVTYLEEMGEGIMGVTLEVEDIAEVRDQLFEGTGRRFLVHAVPGVGLRLLVSPNYTHGVWIEFLQPR